MTVLATPLSDVAVINMAATTLDDKRVTSINDNSPLARFAKDELSLMRDELLEIFPWPFAKKYAPIPASGDEPPFGWDYAYDLPDDCIRPLPLRTNGEWEGEPIVYSVVGTQLYTNQEPPLNLVYIKRVTDFGKMSPLFARALGQYLALGAAQRVTGKSSYLDKSQKAFDAAVARASQVASLSGGTPEGQYRNNLIAVRGR